FVSPANNPTSIKRRPPQNICCAAPRNGDAACFTERESSEPADQMNDDKSKIDIPIAGRPLPENRNAGPSRIATPKNPPASPTQTIGAGRGVMPDNQPSKVM